MECGKAIISRPDPPLKSAESLLLPKRVYYPSLALVVGPVGLAMGLELCLDRGQGTKSWGVLDFFAKSLVI